MKQHEIETIFTEKVAACMAAGYIISPATMSGHQGEIGKVDLRKGNEIIRIMLEKKRGWDREHSYPWEAVVLTVGRSTDELIPCGPFDTWQTVWNNHLEIIEQRSFYQIDSRADYFTENRDAYMAMVEKQAERWHNSEPREGVTTVRLDSAKAAEIAQRYLRRVTGKSRIPAGGLSFEKRSGDCRTKYLITYRAHTYVLH